jgi:hypothetical protein
VRVAAPTRTFEFTFRIRSRLLFWTVERQVTRRYRVDGLPLRELIVLYGRLAQITQELGRPLSINEALLVILGGGRDPLFFTPEQAEQIYAWHCEANRLALPKGEATAVPSPMPESSAPDSSSSSSGSSDGPSESARNESTT